MATTTSIVSGLASGLDTASIIEPADAAGVRPQNRLKTTPDHRAEQRQLPAGAQHQGRRPADPGRGPVAPGQRLATP